MERFVAVLVCAAFLGLVAALAIGLTVDSQQRLDT